MADENMTGRYCQFCDAEHDDFSGPVSWEYRAAVQALFSACSERASNQMRRLMGYCPRSVEWLRRASDEDILSLRNVGVKTLAEVRSVLKIDPLIVHLTRMSAARLGGM